MTKRITLELSDREYAKFQRRLKSMPTGWSKALVLRTLLARFLEDEYQI